MVSICWSTSTSVKTKFRNDLPTRERPGPSDWSQSSAVRSTTAVSAAEMFDVRWPDWPNAHSGRSLNEQAAKHTSRQRIKACCDRRFCISRPMDHASAAWTRTRNSNVLGTQQVRGATSAEGASHPPFAGARSTPMIMFTSTVRPLTEAGEKTQLLTSSAAPGSCAQPAHGNEAAVHTSPFARTMSCTGVTAATGP